MSIDRWRSAVAVNKIDTVDAAVRWLRDIDGLGYYSGGGVAGRDLYVQLIYPHDQHATRLQMGSHQSSCALVGLAYLRRLLPGSADRELTSAYVTRIGRAVSDLVTVARRTGCWMSRGNQQVSDFFPGDLVLIGDNGRGGLEHIDLLVERTGSGTWLTVSGGQGMRGANIASRERALSGQLFGGRVLTGRLAVSLLLEKKQNPG